MWSSFVKCFRLVTQKNKLYSRFPSPLSLTLVAVSELWLIHNYGQWLSEETLTLGDSLTIHLLLTSAELCTKQEKLWILSSISYSVVGSSLTAAMKRGIITLSAYRQCHMWVLNEETLEGIWTSQQQQQGCWGVGSPPAVLHSHPFCFFAFWSIQCFHSRAFLPYSRRYFQLCDSE